MSILLSFVLSVLSALAHGGSYHTASYHVAYRSAMHSNRHTSSQESSDSTTGTHGTL